MWFIPSGTAQAASCTEHVLEAEQELSIPRGLLLSIALVESGQDGSPQPFAMNLDGKTVYSDSADEAKNHLLDNKGGCGRTPLSAACSFPSSITARTSARSSAYWIPPPMSGTPPAT